MQRQIKKLGLFLKNEEPKKGDKKVKCLYKNDAMQKFRKESEEIIVTDEIGAYYDKLRSTKAHKSSQSEVDCNKKHRVKPKRRHVEEPCKRYNSYNAGDAKTAKQEEIVKYFKNRRSFQEVERKVMPRDYQTSKPSTPRNATQRIKKAAENEGKIKEAQKTKTQKVKATSAKKKRGSSERKPVLVQENLEVIEISSWLDPMIEKKKKKRYFKKYYKYSHLDSDSAVSSLLLNIASDSHKLYQENSEVKLEKALPKTRQLKLETHVSSVTIKPQPKKKTDQWSQIDDKVSKKQKPVRSKIPVLNTARREADGGAKDGVSQSPRSEVKFPVGRKGRKYRAWERISTRTSNSNSTFGDKSAESQNATSYLFTKNYKDEDKVGRLRKRKQYADTVRKNLINRTQKAPEPIFEVRYLTVSTNTNEEIGTVLERQNFDFYTNDMPENDVFDEKIDELLLENSDFLRQDFSVRDFADCRHESEPSPTSAGSLSPKVEESGGFGSLESGYSTTNSRPGSATFFQRANIRNLLEPSLNFDAQKSSEMKIQSIASKSLQAVAASSQKSVQIQLSREELADRVAFRADAETQVTELPPRLGRKAKIKDWARKCVVFLSGLLSCGRKS